MRTKMPFLLGFLIFLLVFALISAAFCGLAQKHGASTEDVLNHPSPAPFTVVLDAGHGGEDGGAVSASGIYEKDLNLSLTMLVRDLLVANGVNVVMTRETDVLLYDRNEDYQGRKKALDLAARRKIAEETDGAVFVSIHMNSYPLPQYDGLQVWYSPNNAHSKVLAETIQGIVCEQLQPENDRQVKQATQSIYLLHHLKCPAVLVECGFLSNPTEAERLNDPEYREQLAFLIFLSIMEAQSR
ncbi:MAG: N-acetylmuramoyl-L-alanine amidase [Clostridia bacterium]|nr:N-acetylmuramoyl-L-alanine amidase [Clostridia bacterium]